MPDIGRVIVLGASNVALGLPTLVSVARAMYGPQLELVTALGHGRSFGIRSSLLYRDLPGILESGLWQALDDLPAVPSLALVTDVGNDLLYGFSAAQILAWVDECVTRLQTHTSNAVLTGLPLESICRLTKTRFALFRSILYPNCRLSYAEICREAEQLAAGLQTLAAQRGIRFVQPPLDWYGMDPIHVRRRKRREAWREYLCDPPHNCPMPKALSLHEALRLRFLRPERRWVMGREQFRPQMGYALPNGGRVWLY